jgi:hypothetical protein
MEKNKRIKTTQIHSMNLRRARKTLLKRLFILRIIVKMIVKDSLELMAH